MTNNAPPDYGLMLVIKEPNSVKWSEECAECTDGVSDIVTDCTYDSDGAILDREERPIMCAHCEGTGKREAWVEGEVRVQIWANTQCCYRVALAEYFPEIGGWLVGKEYSHETPHSELNLIEQLTELFRAHTLPAALLHPSEGGTNENGLRKVTR